MPRFLLWFPASLSPKGFSIYYTPDTILYYIYLWQGKLGMKCVSIQMRVDGGGEPFTSASLRATSHMRLKAHDHCHRRAFIGRKDGDRPSLLHTRRWRSRYWKKTSWRKSLHGVPHGRLCIRFHALSEYFVRSTSKRWAWHKLMETIILIYFPIWQISRQIP